MHPLSDIRTRIRNAISNDRSTVIVPSTISKLAHEVLLRLVEEGFLRGLRRTEAGLEVLIIVAKPAPIRRLYCVSRPSRRVYLPNRALWGFADSTVGCLILSTSQGVLTQREARKRGLGGEVLVGVA